LLLTRVGGVFLASAAKETRFGRAYLWSATRVVCAIWASIERVVHATAMQQHHDDALVTQAGMHAQMKISSKTMHDAHA